MKHSEQLAQTINALTKEKWNTATANLLWWLYGTIMKRYDEEEQSDTIISNCKEWENNPKVFD